MLRALDRILTRLKKRFDFITVPELLRHGPAVRVNWYLNSPPELEIALRQHALVQSRSSSQIGAVARRSRLPGRG